MAEFKPIPSNPRFQDLTGLVFGGSTVLGFVGQGHNNTRWLCLCRCGREFVTSKAHLTGRSRKGCKGCFGDTIRTHGLSKTPIGRAWTSAKNRCYSKDHKAYHWYGGRGIRMCDQWLNSCEQFAKDMGERPSRKHSVDRIDNDGDYTPENCRWATSKEQCNNRRNTVRISVHGNTLTITEWAEKLGVKRSALKSKIRHLGGEQAVLRILKRD